MNTIRPGFTPPQPQAPAPRANASRLAAQQAFFALAAGKAAPVAQPAAPAQTAAPARAAASTERMPTPGAEPPTKVMRPGSLLDIRV